jgi:5'-phosphate synthase pdxT subunit
VVTVRVGILALQGDVAEHASVVRACGAEAVDVRTPDDLRAADALIMPGGESTAIGMLMARSGLDQVIRGRAREGMPILGTCAGAILLARDATGGRPRLLHLMDITVARNAYGRQTESFETDLHIAALGAPMRVAFIRAPIIEAVGDGVEILATFRGRPVLVRQGALMAATFHPEVLGQTALHRFFLGARTAAGGAADRLPA